MMHWCRCAISGSTRWQRSKAMKPSAPQNPIPSVLRVALIGAGARGAEWLPALLGPGAAALGVVLTAVCDLDPDSRSSTLRGAVPADIPRPDDLATVLALRPDIIVDATSPLARLAITRVAMRAGVHVLCAPPLALDGATALTLVGAAARAQGRFAVGYQSRHRAGLRQLGALAASGVMGRPLALRAVLAAGDDLSLQTLLSGPGAEACDAARAILGRDAVDVRCSAPPFDARFQMADGLTFDLVGGGSAESWHLQLEGGRAICDGAGPARMANGDAALPPSDAQPEGPAGTLSDLVTAIRAGGTSGGTPGAGPRGAAASLAMGLAAQRSAHHGGRTETVMPLGLMSDASQSPAARAPRLALTPTGEV